MSTVDDDSDSDQEEFLPSGLSQNSISPASSPARNNKKRAFLNRNGSNLLSEQLRVIHEDEEEEEEGEENDDNQDSLTERRRKRLTQQISNTQVNQDITSLDQIRWFCRNEKSVYKMDFCFIQNKRDYVSGLKVSQNFDPEKKAAIMFLSYDDPGNYGVAERSKLKRFHERSVEEYFELCPHWSQEERFKERLWIDRVVQVAKGRDIHPQGQGEQDEEESETTVTPESPKTGQHIEHHTDHEDDFDDHGVDEFDDSDSNMITKAHAFESKKAQLRVGDLISYCYITSVSGRLGDIQEAYIMAIKARAKDFPLVLSSGDNLPKDYPVKLLKRAVRNKWEDVEGSIKQQIQHYRLTSGTISGKLRSRITTANERIYTILDKNEKHLQEKLAKDGLGQFADAVCMGKAPKQYSGTKRKEPSSPCETPVKTKRKLSTESSSSDRNSNGNNESERCTGSPTPEPSNSAIENESHRIGAVVAYLQETLAVVQTKSKRAQSGTHFGAFHLQLALEVWAKMSAEKKTLEDLVDEALPNYSVEIVEKYLGGDRKKVIQRKKLSEIANELQAWLKKTE